MSSSDLTPASGQMSHEEKHEAIEAEYLLVRLSYGQPVLWILGGLALALGGGFIVYALAEGSYWTFLPVVVGVLAVFFGFMGFMGTAFHNMSEHEKIRNKYYPQPTLTELVARNERKEQEAREKLEAEKRRQAERRRGEEIAEAEHQRRLVEIQAGGSGKTVPLTREQKRAKIEAELKQLDIDEASALSVITDADLRDQVSLKFADRRRQKAMELADL